MKAALLILMIFSDGHEVTAYIDSPSMEACTASLPAMTERMQKVAAANPGQLRRFALGCGTIEFVLTGKSS